MNLNNWNNLKKPEKTFHITVFITFIFSIYLILHFKSSSIPSFIMGSISFILSIIAINHPEKNGKWAFREIILIILLIQLASHLPIYFVAVARICYNKDLKDDQLIKIDNYLLGWLFPKGQLSLFLDVNDLFGPHTNLGQFIHNSLQIFYFLYYIIPYVSMYIILWVNLIKENIYRFYHNGKKSNTYEISWNQIFFIFSVYNLCYISIFLINTLIPASSPRIYLKDEFTQILSLTGFAKFLNKTCKDNKSANSFPSGHVAEPLCIAFVLYNCNRKILGILAFIGSFFIFIAILFLRYHYFIDGLIAVFVAIFVFLIPYCFCFKNIDFNLYDNNNNINNNSYLDDLKLSNQVGIEIHKLSEEEDKKVEII